MIYISELNLTDKRTSLRTFELRDVQIRGRGIELDGYLGSEEHICKEHKMATA